MSRARMRPGRCAAACAAIAVLAGGCGSVAAGAAAPAGPPVSLPLATSLSAGQTTWAVIPMGAASGPNLFWQLFKLPAGGASWALATPPDVATNGAIALGVQAGQSLVAGIHPSLLLDFSPITSTPDGGRTWSVGAPDPGLANVPDALATGPRGGQLIALNRSGSAELSRGGGTSSWTTLISTRALRATPAGRACQLTGLTAAAFEPSGPPVLGGICARPGTAGVFAYQGGTWHAAGPPLPGSLSARPTQVLRLTRTGSRLTAVLQAGTGRTASLLTAWTTGSTWTLSPALPLRGRSVVSSSFGSTGGTIVVLSGGRGELLAGPGASWQQLPRLPPGRTVTLALPAGGGVDALAAAGSSLTVWRLPSGQGGVTWKPGATSEHGATWSKTQQVKVPIQYGSSG
ncbi:MAG TPA: hypothetical protein VIJ82_24245 [Streptosporangiaceae bacterium]